MTTQQIIDMIVPALENNDKNVRQIVSRGTNQVKDPVSNE